MGTGGFFPEVKRPGREVDHSPPTSAEVKKMRIYTSTPPYAFMAWCLIKLSTGTTLLFLPLPLILTFKGSRLHQCNFRPSEVEKYTRRGADDAVLSAWE
jgi:hypothetical protein